MAKVNDLVSKQHLDQDQGAQGAQVWYATVVGPAPAAAGDDLYVEIPEIMMEIKFGPCYWNAGAGTSLPVVGSEALVIFDNRQQPWVVAWQT